MMTADLEQAIAQRRELGSAMSAAKALAESLYQTKESLLAAIAEKDHAASADLLASAGSVSSTAFSAAAASPGGIPRSPIPNPALLGGGGSEAIAPPPDAQVGELVAELARARGKLASQDEMLRERETELSHLKALSEGLRQKAQAAERVAHAHEVQATLRADQEEQERREKEGRIPKVRTIDGPDGEASPVAPFSITCPT